VCGVYHMFEFLVGFVLGVWAGQSVPLPSVGDYVRSYWVPRRVPAVTTAQKEEEEQPLFTGTMPLSVPTADEADEAV